MSYSLEEIAGVLKAARQKKQLSQRELSDRVGLPQSHISKIENAAVDLKLSSLRELARALELELVLVPKKALPAVQSLIRTSSKSLNLEVARSSPEARTIRRLKRSTEELQKLQPNLKALREMQRMAEEIRRFQLPDQSVNKLKEVANQMEKFQKQWESLKPYTLDQATMSSIQNLSKELSDLRNRTVHSFTFPGVISTSAPAYQLTADEDDG
ncbi:MAG: helix-turn-helix domain-containing protein [Woeseiaceae bacterium]|nr:helix-turn-helix domain-containing protein [Woeseiaceae bacterium]